ncbi:MAG: tRNA pseudouridine(38-40) synthase [Bacillariaceae sp.]|jgi:tRNA pseudouridine(38-40) synthase
MVKVLRRSDGFARYAVSLQYHGGTFLGFSFQGSKAEDCILPNCGTDLRGYRSVEGRLRDAMNDLFGGEKDRWENIQPSSRTDRGVHAIKNTFHVDIRHQIQKQQHQSIITTTTTTTNNNNNNNNNNKDEEENNNEQHQIIRKLRRGLNFYLKKSQNKRNNYKDNNDQPTFATTKHRQSPVMNEMRILNAIISPEYMENPYASTIQGKGQPHKVDWNARFSATQRTYVYRLLCYPFNDDVQWEYGIPFEWDRSWCIRRGMDMDNNNNNNNNNKKKKKGQGKNNEILDIEAMRLASLHLQGTHDFSTFRGRKCQRHSPIVTMRSIQIHSQSYGSLLGWNNFSSPTLTDDGPRLVTISFVGDSFLYRQVRNMVGCLVQVGLGKVRPENIPDLLKAKDRKVAPDTAPPQGLFLVDVQHGNFQF